MEDFLETHSNAFRVQTQAYCTSAKQGCSERSAICPHNPQGAGCSFSGYRFALSVEACPELLLQQFMGMPPEGLVHLLTLSTWPTAWSRAGFL